jgi:multidrug transporter EmrE-like cation transporter
MNAAMINAAVLLVYVVVSTFGLYMLKRAAEPMSMTFAIGFVSYAIGFLIWLFLLMRMPLSVAFPLAAGGLIVATQVAGVWFLDERITALHTGGVALILAGIVMIYARA